MLAAIYHSAVPRLILVGLLLVGIQDSLLVDVRPFGVTQQILLAFSVACGVAAGSDRGALAGFVLGIMYDLTIDRALGSSSISFGLGAVVGGWIHLIRLDKRLWLNAIFVALGSLVGELMVPVVRLLLGSRVVLSIELAWIALVVSIGAGLMTPLLMPPARWVMKVSVGQWRPERVKSLDSTAAS